MRTAQELYHWGKKGGQPKIKLRSKSSLLGVQSLKGPSILQVGVLLLPQWQWLAVLLPPHPGSLTLLQPLQFFPELSLLPGQWLHVIQADIPLVSAVFGWVWLQPALHFSLKIKVLMQWSPDHMPLHSLHDLEAIEQDSLRHCVRPDKSEMGTLTLAFNWKISVWILSLSKYKAVQSD